MGDGVKLRKSMQIIERIATDTYGILTEIQVVVAGAKSDVRLADASREKASLLRQSNEFTWDMTSATAILRRYFRSMASDEEHQTKYDDRD
jgi:hypothetical protein